MRNDRPKKPLYKRWWVWLLALILIGAALGGGKDDEKPAADQGGKTPVVVATPQETPAENPVPVEPPKEEVVEVGIGKPATIADVTFIVNSVEETKEIKSGNQFIDNAKTEGKFIILDITVKNDKKESLTIHSSYFKLISADGVEYDPSTDSAVIMAMSDEADFFLQQVNPGLSKTGKVVFEVGPNLDVTTTLLRGQTGFWGTETVEISLKP